MTQALLKIDLIFMEDVKLQICIMLLCFIKEMLNSKYRNFFPTFSIVTYYRHLCNIFDCLLNWFCTLIRYAMSHKEDFALESTYTNA